MAVSGLVLAALLCTSLDPRAGLLALATGAPNRERGVNGLDLTRGEIQILDSLSDMTLTESDQGKYLLTVTKTKQALVNAWFLSDPEATPKTFGYVVACAFARGQTVTVSLEVEKKTATWGPWSGRFGLSKQPLKPLADVDDKRRVSACMLAHANQKHARQYISLRGGDSPLLPGERFTMGYPEGIFFGDLFTTPASRERYTLSLNLPAGYDVATADWWPPNAALGRTVDFDATGLVNYLGRCLDSGPPPEGTRHAKRLGEQAAAGDPVHPETAACGFGEYAPPPDLCSGEPVYSPLFVYGPRFINLEGPSTAWTTEPPKGSAGALELFVKGKPKELPCTVARPTPGPNRKMACIGSYDPLVFNASIEGCRWLPTWSSQNPEAEAGVVVLKDGAAVRAVLRSTSAAEEALAGPLRTPFTAIVRFRTDQTGADPGSEHTPLLRTRDGDGAWKDVTATVTWDTQRGTKGKDAGFAWMEVYPVFMLEDDTSSAKRSLAIELVGKSDGAKGPKLDAIGFVPGLPSCCDPAAKRAAWCPAAADTTPRAGVCPDNEIDD